MHRLCGAGKTWIVWTVSASVLFAMLFLAGCGDPSSAGTKRAEERHGLEGKLVLTGSSTVAPVMVEIARRFEELHPGVRVDVQTGGSSRGIADVRSGVANLGMVSRALKVEEQDLLAFPIAQDGVCLIVHQSNPILGLRAEQVRAIYTGAVNGWEEVGGGEGPITVVNKAEGRATLEVFQKFFALSSEEIEADVVIGDNQHGIKTVAGSPSAIAYVSIGAADYEARRGTAIKLLAIGGFEATPEAVARGQFPIARPLNLVVRQEPTGLTAALLEFARSEAVHDLIEAQFFVPSRS